MLIPVLALLLAVPVCSGESGHAAEIERAVSIAQRAGRRAVKIGGAIVNSNFLLERAARIQSIEGGVGQLDDEDMRLLETERADGILGTILLQEREKERDRVGKGGRAKWRNPLAGAFHEGMAIPFWNGYACVQGLMPGKQGACFRDKGIGKALLGCTGKPLKDLDWYASEHCACSACASAAPFTFQHNTISGDAHDIRWTPYCHTRGVGSNCVCGLVDMSIKDKKSCYDLW